MEMRQLSDREGNGRNCNRAKMSELQRQIGQAASTTSFKGPIIKSPSLRGSYSRKSARPDRATECPLDEGFEASLSSSVKGASFTGGIGTPLMRCEGRSLRPLFSRNYFLSGGDNGQDRLIRAQSRLGWYWRDGDNSERISGELMKGFQSRDQG